MNSLFSFTQPERAPSVAPPAPAIAPRAPTPAAMPDPTSNLDKLLTVLRGYATGLPSPNVLITDVTERPLALGNWRGQERRGSFATVALKGGRVDAGVAFHFSAATTELVDNAVTTLQGRLLTARDALWQAGVLRLSAEESPAAEFVAANNVWRKFAKYRVLYEFQYLDTDGAESIIARIPIFSDLEERGLLVRETTTVTDALVRWDDEEAPALTLTATTGAPVRVKGLTSLAYLPSGWTGGAVTLARLRRSATAPPTTYPTLAAFQAAVNDPINPDHHAHVVFPSVAQFLAEFAAAGLPLELGDWDGDGTPDRYQPSALPLNPLLRLESSDDLFQLSYQDSVLNAKAVLYLRAEAYPL